MIVARSSGRTARARSWNPRATPQPSTIVLWPFADTVSKATTGTGDASPSGIQDRIDQHDGSKRRHTGRRGDDLLELRRRRDNRERRAAVGQDERDLFGRQRRIDRNRDRTGGQDREVGDQPLRAALREQRHVIARRHAQGRETKADIADAVHELTPAEVIDAVTSRTADEIWLREPSRNEERQLGDGGRRDRRRHELRR